MIRILLDRLIGLQQIGRKLRVPVVCRAILFGASLAQSVVESVRPQCGSQVLRQHGLTVSRSEHARHHPPGSQSGAMYMVGVSGSQCLC